MKNWTRACLLAMATTAALTVSAGAANFTNRADDLNAMGLFAGSELGYELDRAPERAEAAVMLVRLLGAEAEAKAQNIACPFTDVPDWAAPYIGWLYQQGLTSGATATTFEPSGACSSQMYATFLLRALGYSDAKGDFSYADAIDFATEKHVLDMVNYNANSFLRDNMVAMSYTALAQMPKDGTTTLLAQLVGEGAIDATKAADTLSLFDRYYAINDAMVSMSQPNKMHSVSTMEMDMGELGTVLSEMDMVTTSIFNATDMNASQIFSEGVQKQTLINPDMPQGQDTSYEISSYFNDGVYYMNNMGECIKMPLDYNKALGEQPMTVQSNPICYYDAITETAEGQYTLYFDAGAYEAAVGSLMGNLVDMPTGQETAEMTIEKMSSTITLDGQGNLKTVTTSAEMQVVASNMTMHMVVDNRNDVLAIGDAVTITPPANLDKYISMEEYMSQHAPQ